jgi:N-acetylmuramoyl-L-alanine amidase
MLNIRFKYFFFSFFVYILICPLVANAAPQSDKQTEQHTVTYKIVSDGKVFDNFEMLLIGGMGYVKAYDAARFLGLGVHWFGERKIIRLDAPRGVVEFQVGNPWVHIAGERRRMRKEPQLIDGRVYLPLEGIITQSFSRAVAKNITWDFSSKTLKIEAGVNVVSTRWYSYSQYTRYVIETLDDLKYSVSEKNSHVLEVAIEGALLSGIQEDSPDDGVIKKVTGTQSGSSALFDFYLGSKAGKIKTSKYTSPYRIVVDVENLGGRVEKKEEHPSGEKPRKPPAPIMAPLVKEPVSKIKKVVIDPGHGGRDPGCVGVSGAFEKDINLQLAKRLARILHRDYKMQIVMTRTHDVFVSLTKRAEIANNSGADLFVSIHCNASLRRETKGIEVFFLSEETGNKEAEAVAQRENAVLDLETDKQKADLNKILWSMAMNEYRNESCKLATFINIEMDRDMKSLNRGVKQAGFLVLRGAKMPCCLVEAGFLTNPKEEKQLKNSKYQEKVAQCLARGINKYAGKKK